MVRGTDKFGARSAYSRRHLKYNDYVDKGKSIEGYWLGKACEAYGVERGAAVRDEEFEALRDNEHAVSHEQITLRMNTTRKETFVNKAGELETKEVSNRKPFADLPCGAPKTFSAAVVVFKADVLLECHNRAVAKMRAEMEAITGRQAHNGREHVIRTGNFCAAGYQHNTNRCLEPHLHDHTVIFNMTQDENGKSYAIEFAEYMNQCGYLTEVYRDCLAAEARGYGVELMVDQYGAPQIVKLLDMLEIFSRRTQEIEALIDRIEEMAGTKLTDREAKSIALASRGFDMNKFEQLWEKNKAQLDGLKTLDPEKAEAARREILQNFTAIVRDASLDELQKITAAEVQAGQQSLLNQEQKARGEEFVRGLVAVERADHSRSIEDDIAFSIEHLFSNKSVVQEYELLEAILKHAQGKDVDISHMKAVVRANPKLVFGQGGEVGPVEHYKRELENIVWVEEGKGRGVAIQTKGLSDQLNESQRQAVKELLECRDQFSMLYGIHGVGKTFSLSEVARKYLEAGHKVCVLAPENGAREVLHEDALKLPPGAAADVFKRANNLSEFLINPKWRRDLGPGDLVILDEAGMSNLEDLNNLMRLAMERGFGVQLAGDDGQLTSVTAGDAFRILKERSSIHVSELKEIIRQTPEALDGAYLRAAKLFGEKKKKIREGMWELHKAGVIKEAKGQARIEAYADRVMQSLDGRRPAVMCNVTHRENDVIAEIVRQRRCELGQLTDERSLNVHRSLGWTSAQKREINRIKAGQILQITRGRDKGRAWKVMEVANGKAITEDASGQRREFRRTHAQMFDVCEQREIKVSVGDHLRTHSGGRNKGGEIINGELFVVAGWDSDGNPVGTNGKALTIRNVSYGYTGTVRKVQGATKANNIFGVDRRSIRAVSAEIATVACTRGREDIEILVESIADLSQIENKSSQRKAVCEMALENGSVPADARELLTRIEQARAGQQAKAKRVAPEKHQVDLEAGKTVGMSRKPRQPQPHIPPPEMDKSHERGFGYER
jgi:conjugative relaxase-like TrwC/TraI family protein